jgi:hypothetical protein
MNTRETSQVVSLMVLALAVVSAWVEKAGADFTFGTPINLGPTVNSSSDDLGAEITTDGLELYFSSNRSGGFGDWDLYVATRETTQDDWGTPVNLGSPPNSQYGEWESSVSNDGLSLYFSDVYPKYGSQRPDGLGMRDIWISTRPTKADPWAAPENLGIPINSQWGENWPAISADGLSLYLCCHTTERVGFGLYDIFVARRQTTSEPFGEPVNLGPNVNSSTGDITPAISADELILFFYRGDREMWMATRRNTSDPFGPAIKVPEPVNTSAYEDGSPYLSADGYTLYFCSNRSGGFGGYDLWQVSISPVVDLNSDGVVDAADMCIIVDNWGTDDPLCDIGPTPFGDGIVDVQDLIILAEHLFEEVPSAEPVG